MSMWEPFTERARRSIVLAQEEAQRLGNNYIGTEHILLGIISEGESLAAKVLESLGVNLAKVRQEVEAIVGRGGQTVQQEMVFTPRAKRVIELAFEEARQLNHNYIGTEHLLLGLIREGEGVAARVLTNLGVDPAKVRVQTTSLLGAEGQPPAPKGKSKTPTLDAYGRDLTQLARENKLDPVIGRNNEIERVIQILSRRTKNNPALIGEPGVGKTAIAEGLAQRVIKGDIPEPLRERRVITLDLAGLVAGTKYRGEFEERMKRVMDEIRGAAGEIILFIDELHTLVGAGAAEGAIDASNIIKPALARGELQCIGATTLNEFRKHIEKDSALERRFQPVMVGEPSVEETVEILMGLRDRYEAHHKVQITDQALAAAAKLSDRYITDRFLPDKAVDLIDEASSRVRLQATLPPAEIREVDAQLRRVIAEKESVVKNQEFEKAASIRDREEKLRLEKSRLEGEWQEKKAQNADKPLRVTEENVAEIVSSWTKIPVSRLAQAETEKLLNMGAKLHERIVGQDEGINVITRAIRRSRAGLKNPNRPIGSFLFLGPTGVGKTEVARSLAEFMFDDEESMIRIDMSEYMEKYSVSRLVGAPPGYVGYEEGGQLTEAVRRRPYSVVLLDEIEKAHPDVFNLLLQVLDDGRLTDSQGRQVDFKNTVIIMTSNVGAAGMQTTTDIGFRPQKGSEDDETKGYERMKNKVLEEVKHTFRPEFLNRVDEVVVFHQLSKAQIEEIVGLELEKVLREVRAQDMHLKVTDAAKTLLAKKGWDPQFGARPLRRAIQRNVEDELAEEMLKGTFVAGDHVLADVDSDDPEKLKFSKIPSIELPAEPSEPAHA
ncbi:MAG TPA: ATP-dependent Clp protease ATP-binding subunit [Candidatus Baltobacteraceae bacterium]|nr:ATP-dependent Clp protease ATP-binding subunit [Candidatus Baltobacteraceae bacterium]